jgi:hypothetical protein
LVGPVHYSGGFNFIFTVIDHTSKWIEAIPSSNRSTAACAKALVFLGFLILGCPKWSLLIVGRNLLQIFGPSFVKCYKFCIAKQQLIILSRTVQSKESTAISRVRFTHAPPQRLCTAERRHWFFTSWGSFWHSNCPA